ncbi:type VI secretion system baseplate subunit TssE [Propionivibrio soli]|uniref:type VI secretion system baseplate subunit TssE n=1 Tax=Propionivibrio soli TaxID=2976531 RepID=UPI0021E9413D|nr:type VI secretion system baseplate subunit TssE [Propionivibrio soli]
MRADLHGIRVQPSVLDRLLDDDPKEAVESRNQQMFDLRRLKQAVARDIEALLNTRCVDPEETLETFPQARNSMIGFGITDLSSLSLLNPSDRAYLRDKIRQTVERHEPRLGAVRVSLDTPTDTDRTLRFRVDAFLEVLPTRPPVSFDARLQLSSNSCQVREN